MDAPIWSARSLLFYLGGASECENAFKHDIPRREIWAVLCMPNLEIYSSYVFCVELKGQQISNMWKHCTHSILIYSKITVKLNPECAKLH